MLRDALGRYPTGVTVVTTRGPDGRPIGLTVNSFASLSLSPPLLLWSLANGSPNREAFRQAPGFVVHVLSADQEALARRFADPRIPDKFAGVTCERHSAHDEALGTPPLLADVLARFVCTRHVAIDAGDHTLFIGRVERVDTTEGPALTFHRGRFGACGPLQRSPA